MSAKEAVSDGVEVTNAEWVIRRYFGASVYNKVVTNPENFYLVLEPTVSCFIYAFHYFVTYIII